MQKFCQGITCWMALLVTAIAVPAPKLDDSPLVPISTTLGLQKCLWAQLPLQAQYLAVSIACQLDNAGKHLLALDLDWFAIN